MPNNHDTKVAHWKGHLKTSTPCRLVVPTVAACVGGQRLRFRKMHFYLASWYEYNIKFLVLQEDGKLQVRSFQFKIARYVVCLVSLFCGHKMSKITYIIVGVGSAWSSLIRSHLDPAWGEIWVKTTSEEMVVGAAIVFFNVVANIIKMHLRSSVRHTKNII